MCECPDCKMLYVPESADDFLEHRKYHDKVVNGLPAKSIKSDRVIWEQDGMYITVVNQLAQLVQRRRAENVAILVHSDTGFDFRAYSANEPLDERNVHVFTLYTRSRAIGLLVLEKLGNVWRVSWAKYDSKKEVKQLLEYPAIWSICMVWVLKRYRGQGLAQTLINEALSYLGISIEEAGWYTHLISSGEVLARRLCKSEFYIAK